MEGAFAGSTVFMCTQPAEPCVFCGAPSVALCDWPVERRELRKAYTLKPGETILFLGSRRELVAVEESMNQMIGLAVELTWTYKGKNQQPYLVSVSHPIDVLIPGAATCDNPVCDLHRRNLDEERDHCREHWTAWEGVV